MDPFPETILPVECKKCTYQKQCERSGKRPTRKNEKGICLNYLKFESYDLMGDPVPVLSTGTPPRSAVAGHPKKKKRGR